MHKMWLTILLVACLGLWVSALAAAPQPASGEQAEKPAAGSEPGADGPLVTQQRQVAERFRELEKLLLRMAELTAPTDPRRAALLRQAVAQSKQRDIDHQFEALVELLQKERLAPAVKSQGEVHDDLAKLLELLLSEDRSKRIESEKERVREYLKRVNKIIKEQKSIQGETGRDTDPRKLADRQGDLADKTGEIAKQMQDEAGKKPASEKPSGEQPDQDKSPKDQPDADKDPQGKDPKDKPAGDKKDGDTPKDPSEPDADKKDAPKKENDKKDVDKKETDKKDADPKDADPKDADAKPGDQESKPGEKADGKPQDSQPNEAEGQSSENSGESAQNDNPAQKRLEQAQKKRMKEAQDKLEEAKRTDAKEKQAEAIKELEQAKAELEEILRQLREEEMQRMLAMLETRFRKMLDEQVAVYEGTKRVDKIPAAERDRDDEIEAGRLSRKESQIAIEADKALAVLREEGSAVAFPEAVSEMRDDMGQVVDRLAKTQVGDVTQGIEKDIIAALEEMIASLQKAQKDMENQKPPQGQPGEGDDDETPLVDTISELKMIRALQMRVNTRTQRYAEMTKTEQTDTPELLDALKRLGEREQRIHKVTRDIVVGRNR